MIDINDLSILVVDDMDSMRRSIRGMLKVMKIGTRIQNAPNGKEAWKVLNESEVDLAIIDWNMPVMNGQELLECIRASKEHRDMPVIMISAENTRNIITDVAESDIDAYLLKPLTIQALEDKIKNIVKLTNEPPPSRVHLLKARELEEIGRFHGAIEETKSALKESPKSSRIIRKLGLLYAKTGKDDIAEKCFTKAAAVNKDDTITRALLVDLYIKNDNLKGAVKYFNEAVAISPHMVDKGFDIGKFFIKKGLIDQAIKIFDSMTKKTPHKNKMREKIADIYLENGLYPFAREILEKISKAHPERHDISLKIGELYEREGDSGGALIYYVKADDAVNDNVEAKLLIAKIYLEKGKIFLADEYLNAVLKINPNNEEALELRKHNI